MVAGKIIKCMEVPFTIAGQAVHVATSIGISIYPFDGESGDTLLKCADLALYAAKQAGRGRYIFFEEVGPPE